MASYEDFFPQILPDAPGVPEPIAINAIRNACIEFCEKSLILARDLDPITIRQGIIDYDLEADSGYLVTKVMTAFVENTKINPMAPDFVREAAVYNRLFSSYQAQQSTPSAYLQKSERQITIWPVPEKDYSNGLTISVSVDGVLLEDYAEAIASGALRRLMATVGTSYSNPKMAAVHEGMFQVALNVARQRATHGYVRANLSVKLRKI